ncbi:MAG: UDP-N-acetylmuramate dehydrogenase, partial [Muribaculaceae bacterium]|nr:UDP-N-acetylmuramate dehydrogenase [Muribaculaceae bacterium]
MSDITFQTDYDITHLTTFGIKVKTALYAEYADWKELTRICRSDEYMENEVLHIGGGSNLLFVHDFNGLILHSAIKGIVEYDRKDDQQTVFVIAGAAEKWDDLVQYCVEHNLAGMENLSGIPGEVGASPVQNVGAYGVEAGDIIHNVEVFDRTTRRVETIPGEECGFAYRDSKFKNEWRDRYYVLRVSFRLHRSEIASNTEYGALRGLEQRLGHVPTLRDVREEVIKIRDSKLPNPAVIGSAGSFFKNPIVRQAYYEKEMLIACPDIPRYRVDEVQQGSHYIGDTGYVKVPAGWLIEHAGLKNASVGGAVVYPDNCLVIANRGNATAGDVTMLAEKVRRQINRMFHVWLQPEVNYIDTEIKITILGSGTSKGVPEVGCDCDTCISSDPRDKRLRCSSLIETMGLKILIDPSPDFRQQAIREGIHNIDAVLITHE